MDLQGKITLAVSSREGQLLRCYLNGEQLYDDFLRPNQTVIDLKFEPQLLGTIVNEHKLEFSFPESTKPQENKSEKESIFVSSILIQ